MATVDLPEVLQVWKDVPSAPGIEASNFGQLRHKASGRILSQHVDKKGYYNAVVSGDRYRKRTSVCVCEAFHGPRPTDRHFALHNNGISTDNRSSNLRWGTQKENREDMILHGTVMHGEINPIAKLTDELVEEIRATFQPGVRRSDGLTQEAFGAMHGIKQSTVSGVVRRKSWRHI